MDILQAINERHSVRLYSDKPIETEALAVLQEEVRRCNEESGLRIQLMVNEPKAFGAGKTSYGLVKNAANYFALVGTPGEGFEEKCGYFGQRLVLKAQQLGLNTCWVGLTYKKGHAPVDVREGEKLLLVIALGYGVTPGTPHKSKSSEKVSNLTSDSPDWFRKGVETALLAPTAVNQQQFYLSLEKDEKVAAKAKLGFFAKVDLGIVKYHFELGAGKENIQWV
ncbi:MAG: nitroreductase [Clostridiales bacterium]|nr:nitroreductase [Clostridiales bacterium]